jgi:HEPN domain-containing protein
MSTVRNDLIIDIHNQLYEISKSIKNINHRVERIEKYMEESIISSKYRDEKDRTPPNTPNRLVTL